MVRTVAVLILFHAITQGSFAREVLMIQKHASQGGKKYVCELPAEVLMIQHQHTSQRGHKLAYVSGGANGSAAQFTKVNISKMLKPEGAFSSAKIPSPIQDESSFGQGLDHEYDFTKHPPTAAYKHLYDMLARNAEFSKGTLIVGMVILICLLVICAGAISEGMGGNSYNRPVPRYPVHLSGRQVAAQKPPLMPVSTSPLLASPVLESQVHSHQVHSYPSTPSRAASLMNSQNLIPAAALSQGVAAPSWNQNKPAAMCQDLVVIVDSWYAVGFEAISLLNGTFPIYGRGKKLLLTAHIQKSPVGSGSVHLTMGDIDGPVLGTLSSTGSILMLHDKRGRPYGQVHSIGELAYSLRCGSAETIRFNTDVHTGKIILVNLHDGTHLASAAKSNDVSDLPSQEDHLAIEVVAGMDPVLTILCILGLMAFDPVHFSNE